MSNSNLLWSGHPTWCTWNSTAQTTSSAVMTNLNAFAWTLNGNDLLAWQCVMRLGCTGGGGITFRLTAPTLATTNFLAYGNTTTPSTATANWIASPNTATTAFNTMTGNTGWVEFSGTVSANGTSGTCQLQFASGVSGQTSTVFQGGYLMIQRIN